MFNDDSNRPQAVLFFIPLADVFHTFNSTACVSLRKKECLGMLGETEGTPPPATRERASAMTPLTKFPF